MSSNGGNVRQTRRPSNWPHLPIHLSVKRSFKKRCTFEPSWQGAESCRYKVIRERFNLRSSGTTCDNCGGFLYHWCRSCITRKCQLVKKPRGIVDLTTALRLTKLYELCFHVPFIVCFCHVYIKSYKWSKLHNDFMDTLYRLVWFEQCLFVCLPYALLNHWTEWDENEGLHSGCARGGFRG